MNKIKAVSISATRLVASAATNHAAENSVIAAAISHTRNTNFPRNSPWSSVDSNIRRELENV